MSRPASTRCADQRSMPPPQSGPFSVPFASASDPSTAAMSAVTVPSGTKLALLAGPVRCPPEART